MSYLIGEHARATVSATVQDEAAGLSAEASATEARGGAGGGNMSTLRRQSDSDDTANPLIAASLASAAAEFTRMERDLMRHLRARKQTSSFALPKQP